MFEWRYILHGDIMQFEHSEILELSPLGIVICNTDQRILWCNSRFLDDTGLSKANIIGLLYAALPIETLDKNACLVQYFDDKNQTINKFNYWQNDLQSSPNNTVHYFAKIDNSEPLDNPIATRIPQRPNWKEFLDYEVSRSRRYENPLSLLKLQLLIGNNPEETDQQVIFQTVKDSIMDELRWADMVGHNNHDNYLMILPETPPSAIERLITKLSNSISFQLNSLSTGLECQTIFGFSHWQKHDDSQKMLKRARMNLVEKLENILKSIS